MTKSTNTYFKKGLRILLWIIGSVVGLFLLIILLLQVPFVQDFAKERAVSYIEKKIGTKVSIGRLEIGLPKKVILEDFYFESRERDTLLAGEKLSVDISLMKLFSSEVEINSIDLRGVVANVKRGRDSVYNFDYIIEAFASKTPKDTASKPMRFSLDRINLDNIRVKIKDAISGNDADINLTHFETRFEKFNLDKMDFDIPKIRLDGLKVLLNKGLVEEIAQTSVEVADTISKRPDFRLKLGEIELNRINVGYDNKGTRLNTGLSLGKLLLKFNSLDLNRQLIDVKSFELSQVRGNLVFGRNDDKIEVPDTDTTAIKKVGWKLKLDNIAFQDIDFKFDDENVPKLARGIDYNHLDIKKLNLDAEKFYYAADSISAKVNSMTVKDRSGLNVEALRASVFYGDEGAYAKGLYLKTPRTSIRDNISLTYPTKAAIKDDPADVYIDATITNSRIGLADILIFAPQLYKTNPFKDHPNAIILLNTRLSGKVGDIRFPEFSISGIGNTTLSAQGRITGLPDFKKANFDVKIKRLKTTSSDVRDFLPSGTIPSNITLPRDISLNGTFRGKIDNFTTNMTVASSFGGASVKGSFDQRTKNREKYDGDVVLSGFDLGNLIQNDSIGKVTLTAKFSGTGFRPQTANAKIRAMLSSAEYNSYTYKNLALNGNISQGKYNVDAEMNDPNLDFTLAANGGFEGNYPAVKLKLNVDIADLEKLNLHAGPLKLRGNVDADIQDSNPDNLNGTLALHRMQFLTEGDPVILDSISVVAVSTPEKNTIDLKSQFARVSVDGKYKLTQLADAVRNTIAKYYDATPTVGRKKTDPQKLAFTVKIDNDPVLFKLFPQITGLEPFEIKGRFNTEGDTIAVSGKVPRIVYGATTISGADINIDTKDGALTYDFNVDAIQGQQFMLPFTHIHGTVKDNTLAYNLRLRDSEKKEQYVITGAMKQINGQTELRIDPESLKLNYESWTISPDNLLRFGPDGIFADNFELSHESDKLRLQSLGSGPNSPLEASFTDFRLVTLLNMVRKDALLADGLLNGTVVLKNLKSRIVFTSDLTIKDFKFRNELVGDLAISVHNEVADVYTADIDLSGNSNQVSIDGTYRDSSQSFDLDLDMGHLEVKSIQGFTFGNITDGAGFLSGQFKITGTIDEPKANGNLAFNEVGFRVTQLNSYFKGINENVVVNGDAILFDNFTVFDEKNNNLVINGKATTRDYRNFGFDMTVNADNFRAVNSKAKDNDLYYGDLFLDADLVVKGTLEHPAVSGNVRINEDTKFSVVLPQSDPAIAEREGIVEFVDEENTLLKETIIMKNEMDQTQVKGMDVSVNIQINKEALLSLVIDKGNGDYLNLKGEGDLTGGIDPSGKTTLTGKYEFTEGSYEMTFNLLKRKFEIKPGSYIIWNGEPTSADINITAVYKVDAAPIDLLDDQLAGISQSIRNTYKQKIPFQTQLKLGGQLLKPALTFDIILPEGNYGVSSDIVSASRTKLEQLRQDPSEMNKQVFALLLLNRFIGENPFASEAGSGGAETLARQSVSKVLSQQLNTLAGELVKGVELDFDLESTEDYTSGIKENRTDLNVGVSKRLLNDRLKVTIGSSFGLEGQQQPAQQTNTIAGDISADYQLTRDGRYMLRAYRKNEYQVALQGQVIETGLAFIITMDYNEFRELFHRTEEEKQMRERERARRKAEREKAKQPNPDKPISHDDINEK